MLREFHRKGELPPISGGRGSSAPLFVRKSARERIDLGQYPVGAVLAAIEQSGHPPGHRPERRRADRVSRALRERTVTASAKVRPLATMMGQEPRSMP
jgi:hypothetical protein